jgi:hypothetical protein
MISKEIQKTAIDSKIVADNLFQNNRYTIDKQYIKN